MRVAPSSNVGVRLTLFKPVFLDKFRFLEKLPTYPSPNYKPTFCPK